MNPVTELTQVPAPVNDELVTLLEKLLADARTGKLQCIAGVAVFRGGSYDNYLSIPAGIDLYRLIGGLDRIKVRVHRELDEVAEVHEVD